MKTTIILLFISINLCAQKIEKPYPKQIDSKIWIEKFNNLKSNSEKIIQIKNKIISDTLFYNYKKRIILDNPRDPEKHICKILFLIEHNDKYYEIDLLQNPKLTQIMKYIKEDNITEIKKLDDYKSVVLFGNEGVCGIIVMSCNKKLKRKIENVL
ncbi:hypothetical protein [Flavobacterium sp.]|uniref:hypothetical protein n=1 Tax=Flavobacterium sp. TaxID=239 RepID=UPI002FDCC75D